MTALIDKDRKVTVRELSLALGCSVWSVHKMITQDLGMMNICIWWIPHLLSPAEKEKRPRVARKILDILNKRRISDVVSGFEIWMYFYQAARKSESLTIRG
jgi:hypothetical protein